MLFFSTDNTKIQMTITIFATMPQCDFPTVYGSGDISIRKVIISLV